MVIIARRVQFFGQVQGVNFRRNSAKLARSMSLCGWVKNLADGSVEAHIEGEPQAVQAMIHSCCTELFPAKVERFDSHEEQVEGYQDFTVVR